jgi:hypothetical protein
MATGLYTASQDFGLVMIGAAIQIGVVTSDGPISISSCAGLTSLSSHYWIDLMTYNNPPGLPPEWLNLQTDFSSIFGCGTGRTPGGNITSFNWSLTTVSSSRLAGSYDITIQGTGARAGSTLRVHGTFDEPLTPN